MGKGTGVSGRPVRGLLGGWTCLIVEKEKVGRRSIVDTPTSPEKPHQCSMEGSGRKGSGQLQQLLL